MPRSGDAYLSGSLPRSHDPLVRIDPSVPKIGADALGALAEMWRQWWDVYGFPLIEEITGIDLRALTPFDDLVELKDLVGYLTGNFDGDSTFLESWQQDLLAVLGTPLGLGTGLPIVDDDNPMVRGLKDAIYQSITYTEQANVLIDELISALRVIPFVNVLGPGGPANIGATMEETWNAIVGGAVGELGTGASIPDLFNLQQTISSWANLGRLSWDKLGIRANQSIDFGMLPTSLANFPLSKIGFQSSAPTFGVTQSTSTMNFQRLPRDMSIGVVRWLGSGNSSITDFRVNIWKMDPATGDLTLVHRSANIIGSIVAANATPQRHTYSVTTPIAGLAEEVYGFELSLVGAGTHTIAGQSSWIPNETAVYPKNHAATRNSGTGAPPSTISDASVAYSPNVAWVEFGISTGTAGNVYQPLTRQFTVVGTDTMPIPDWADFAEIIGVGGGGGGKNSTGFGANGTGGSAGTWGTLTWERGVDFTGATVITVTVGDGGIPNGGNGQATVVSIPGHSVSAAGGAGGSGLLGHRDGYAPGNITYNGIPYQGGYQQSNAGGPGSFPGGAGAGGTGAYPQGGGYGARGAVWVRVRQRAATLLGNVSPGLTGNGALTAVTRQKFAKTAALTGHGALSGATVIRQNRAATLVGHGGLSAVTNVSASFVNDSMTGTNGTALSAHTGEVGATWAVQGGSSAAGAIQSNRLYSTADSFMYASGTPSSANYEVTAPIRILSAVHNTSVGVCARMSTSQQTHYVAFVYTYSGVYYLYLAQYLNGGYAEIGHATLSPQPTAGSDHTIAIRVVGNQISGLYDGVVQVGPTTNANITAAGKAGVLLGAQSSTTGVHIDSITAAAFLNSPKLSGKGTLAASAHDPSVPFVTRNTSNGNLLLSGVRYRWGGVNTEVSSISEASSGYGGPVDPVTGWHSYSHAETDALVSNLVSMNARVIRNYSGVLCVGQPNSVQPTIGVFNATALEPNDYLLAKCAAAGIRVILPLVDNYQYPGNGKWWYLSQRSISAGGDAEPFFTNSTAIADFKAHINFVLNHKNPYTGRLLKNDPTILAFELGNELTASGLTDSQLASWSDNIGGYIKNTLSAQQLVFDGFYGTTGDWVTYHTNRLNCTYIDGYSNHSYDQYRTPTNIVAEGTNAHVNHHKAFYLGEWNIYVTTTGWNQAQMQTAIEGSTYVEGDNPWILLPQLDSGGGPYLIHYPGDTTDMATRVTSLTSHATTMRS